MKYFATAILVFTCGVFSISAAVEGREIKTGQQIELSTKHLRLRLLSSGRQTPTGENCLAVVASSSLDDDTGWVAHRADPNPTAYMTSTPATPANTRCATSSMIVLPFSTCATTQSPPVPRSNVWSARQVAG